MEGVRGADAETDRRAHAREGRERIEQAHGLAGHEERERALGEDALEDVEGERMSMAERDGRAPTHRREDRDAGDRGEQRDDPLRGVLHVDDVTRDRAVVEDALADPLGERGLRLHAVARQVGEHGAADAQLGDDEEDFGAPAPRGRFSSVRRRTRS